MKRLLSVLGLLLVLVSESLISQTQPAPPRPNTQTSGVSSNKSQTAKPNCVDHGTYVNSKGQTVRRPENC